MRLRHSLMYRYHSMIPGIMNSLDRATGVGRVDEHLGHYGDALERGRVVHLLLAESANALSPDIVTPVVAWYPTHTRTHTHTHT